MKQKKIHEKYIYMKKKIKETKRQKRKRITKKNKQRFDVF